MFPRRAMKNTAVLIAIIVSLFLLCTADGECESFHFLNTTAVNISSLNYPLEYPNSNDCQWNFETRSGSRIKLTFYDFKTEYQSNCNADYVAVYDGNTKDTLLGKFCSFKIPSPVTSTTNRMLVIFHSDGSESYTGFKASAETEFSISYFPGVEEIKRNFALFLHRTKESEAHSINRWGQHISRTAVTLFLYDKHIFNSESKIVTMYAKVEDLFYADSRTGDVIALELSLQLLSKLALKKKISTKDLALYINALTVTCFNPKDFFGFNLVEELRKRVNKSINIHPFSFLTLCNAGDDMKMEDLLKLQKQYNAYVRPVWTDVQAMVVMALSCIHSRSDLNFNKGILNDMVSELKEKQHSNGTIDDWKITTLVVQALLAAGDYRTDFNLEAAIKVIVDDAGNHTNVQDIYYALPILNDMSLVNISSDHCENLIQTESKGNLYDNPAERTQVQITVITGDNMDFFRTWKLKVPLNYSLYQTLETLGTLEPPYKVRYRVSEGKPYVVGLGNFLDDHESGTFWFIYSKLLSSAGTLNLIELSPVDVRINETHEMVLWYRSGILEKSEEE